MKIIHPGKQWKEKVIAGYKCKCWNCGCKFELSSGEEYYSITGEYYFKCPHCGKSTYMNLFNSRKIWRTLIHK